MTQLTVFLRHSKRSNSRQVDLSNRQMQFIPKQVYAISGIQILNISNNKISIIDHDIADLKNLSIFNCSNNLLIELPDVLKQLKKLKSLILNDNPLSKKFECLLQAKNQNQPYLADALQQCFVQSNKLQTKTPAWLLQNQKEENHGLQWDQTIFKRSAKNIRLNQRKINYQCKPESIAKEGVLEIKYQDIQIGQQISMGGFSTIHKGKYAGLQVAVKKVFNPNINDQLMKQFNTQVTMLSKYRHPKIVLLLGAVTTPPNLCIIMQYMKEGTLFDLLHRKKIQLTERQKGFIARQIISVLEYLHYHQIVHRDIKSHNILLQGEYNIKICDFGLARHKSQLNTGPMQFSGTPTYMAQQLFLKKGYDESIDIFALGTLLYELYTAQIPYNGLDPTDIKQKVLSDSNLPFKVKIKKDILQTLNRCRRNETKDRPTIFQLSKLQW